MLSLYGPAATRITASASVFRSPVGTMKLSSLNAVSTVFAASVGSDAAGRRLVSTVASRKLAVSTPLLLVGTPDRPPGWAMFAVAMLAASSSDALLFGSRNLSWISTCPVTVAPASRSMSSTLATCGPVCGIDTTSTRRPVSLPASMIGAACWVNCSCLPVSVSSWLIWSR